MLTRARGVLGTGVLLNPSDSVLATRAAELSAEAELAASRIDYTLNHRDYIVAEHNKVLREIQRRERVRIRQGSQVASTSMDIDAKAYHRCIRG